MWARLSVYHLHVLLFYFNWQVYESLGRRANLFVYDVLLSIYMKLFYYEYFDNCLGKSGKVHGTKYAKYIRTREGVMKHHVPNKRLHIQYRCSTQNDEVGKREIIQSNMYKI